MVSLAGFRLLQDASRQMYFKDLDNLWHALQDPDTVEQCNDQDGRLIKVHLRRPFGQGVRDIAESDNTDQQRTRLTAEYCFRIYAAVMYGMGEAGGEEPWKNERSLVWREDRTCPALLNVKNLPKAFLRQPGERAERQRPERIPTGTAGRADLAERRQEVQDAHTVEAASIRLLVGRRRASPQADRHPGDGAARVWERELLESGLFQVGRRRIEQAAQNGAQEDDLEEQEVSQ